MSDYRYEREGVVSCGADGSDPKHPNCRHEWNAEHPDDLVTVEEQAAHRAIIDAAFEATLIRYADVFDRLADL